MARLAARLDLLVLQLCRAGVIVRKKWIDDDDETAGRRTDDFVNQAKFGRHARHRHYRHFSSLALEFFRSVDVDVGEMSCIIETPRGIDGTAGSEALETSASLDEAVTAIAKSMVTDTAASMAGNTSKAASSEEQLSSLSGRTFSLYRPWDMDHLTDRQCYIRRDLIELVQTGSNRRVHLRCKFCHHVPFADRANGSEVFPRSLSLLSASVASFQKFHLMKCQDIPKDKRDSYCSLPSATHCKGAEYAQSPKAQEYWVESAKEIGLAELEEGNMAGIVMTDVLAGVEENKVQSPSRYNRIKAIADKILSEQTDETQTTSGTDTPAVQSNGSPSKKHKRTKQKGRPRLLKLPVAPHRTCPKHMKNRAGRVGVYLPLARQERIARFHSKRNDRIARFYSKEILYQVRRKRANTTKRTKGGRFVKNKGEMSKKETIEEFRDSDTSEASVADDVEEQSPSENQDTDASDGISEASTVDDDSSTGSEDDVVMATIVETSPLEETEILVAEVISDYR